MPRDRTRAPARRPTTRRTPRPGDPRPGAARAGSLQGARPRGLRHGRQRTLGQRAGPAPHRGARRRRDRPARCGERRPRDRHQVDHPLRLLHRELAPPARRSALPHELQPVAADAPGRRAQREGRADPLRRTPGLAGAPAGAQAHGRVDRAHQAQPAHGDDDGVQLRRPGRDHRRRARPGRRGHPRQQDRREGHPPPPLLPRHARSRPGDPHLGRDADLELLAVGDRLQRAGLPRDVVARHAPRRPLPRRSSSTSSACAASGPSTRSRRAGIRPGPDPARPAARMGE